MDSVVLRLVGQPVIVRLLLREVGLPLLVVADSVEAVLRRVVAVHFGVEVVE